jgi:hypothetical protein
MYSIGIYRNMNHILWSDENESIETHISIITTSHHQYYYQWKGKIFSSTLTRQETSKLKLDSIARI